MSGARSCSKSTVQQVARLAMYYHCTAPCLSLAVVSACKVQAFKNAEVNVGEIAFFNILSKSDNACLREQSVHTIPCQKLKSWKDTCRTRLVEHIDSYAIFLQLLPSVHTCL